MSREPKSKFLSRKDPVEVQKVVLQLESKSIIIITKFLIMATKVLYQHTDLPSINLFRAYFTSYDNLVFDTSLATRGTYYEPSFPARHQTIGNYMIITRIEGEMS